MAELSRFFADVGGDRLTTAAELNRVIDQLLQEKDGVVRGLGNALAVTNSGAVAVDVNTGSAIMGGRPYENTASKNLVLDAVTSGSKRYDRIVVRVDETARTMVLTVIKGVEGASPAAPTIDGTTDVLLAKILLDRSSGSYVYTVIDERVYCDGLLLPAIIAKLNLGTFSPDDLAAGSTLKVTTAAGKADADAIAAAAGATLYARLFGILNATWGLDTRTPAPRVRVSGSGNTAVSTGINVNAGDGGKCILALFSQHSADGDNTNAALYVIRLGYSGDHATKYYIGGPYDNLTISVVGSILYVAGSSGWSSYYVTLIENKI